MAARETGKTATSELSMHLRVSLTDRRLPLIHASVRKAPPRSLPPGSPRAREVDNTLEVAAWGREVESAAGTFPLSEGAVYPVLEARELQANVKRAHPSNLLHHGRRRWAATRPRTVRVEPDPLDAGLVAARANQVRVPSSDPSSDPASVPPSGHDRSTRSRSNAQVRRLKGSSVYWSDSIRYACVHASRPFKQVGDCLPFSSTVFK